MVLAVADTHALIWYVHSDPRMTKVARAALDDAAAAGDQVAISWISLVEIVYLIEKSKIDPTTTDRILELLDLGGVLVEAPVDRPVVVAMKAIDRAQVPDMPDRIIAATALRFGVPVISRDRQIQTSNVATIW